MVLVLSSSFHGYFFPASICSKASSKPSSNSKYLMSLSLPLNRREATSNNIPKWKRIAPEKREVFKSLEGWVEDNILTMLKPVESSWQPQDLLPDPSSRDDDDDEEFFDKVKAIREQVAGVPDEYYVCLAGNMITEEALPTYQTAFNTFDCVRDETGASATPWARWSRGWTAEENRHGDLLNKYLYLSGRIDMRQVEKTVQYLIAAGMTTGAATNPYCGLIYTSFQERATFMSHSNTARHMKRHGDVTLAKICGLIAADEKRHEVAYTKIVEKLFEVDVDTTMVALADMMRKRITMPALLMFDGQDQDLFLHYSTVAENIGVYTTKDYADNVEFFVRRWNVETVSGLSAEGRQSQEYVCGLPDRFRKMEERARDKKGKKKMSDHLLPFTWIFNRKVLL